MQLRKSLPYIFLATSMFIVLFLLFGFAEESRTFGISGTVSFEDASAKGALVAFTTSGDNPFEKDHENSHHFEQYLQESGYFYRKLNEFAGKDVNVWIKHTDYPVVQVSKVLNISNDRITFGKINIPAKLKIKNEVPVKFFKAPCDDEPIVSVEPERIRAVRNFNSVRCKSTNAIQFKAKIDLEKDPHETSTPAIPVTSPHLAAVVF